VIKPFAMPQSNGSSYTNADGANPAGGLVLSGSTLYGTTQQGGSGGSGVVFKVNTDGSDFTVLKSFSEGRQSYPQTNSDGMWIEAGLLLHGNTLYGTSYYGGSSGCGTVFKLHTDGTGFAVLKAFPTASQGYPCSNNEGAYPLAGLVLSGSTLYGTTEQGGSSGWGVIFSLNLAPQIQVSDASFGVRSNCFGFNVTGISNQVVIIEACTDLATSQWVPLQTNTLGSEPFFFSDPAWTNYPGRYYRAITTE
jgi:uncharacterized repeat protein (TIGR03803 family)